MEVNERNELMDNMAICLPTLRRRLNLSQAELAEIIGLNRSTIAAIENKKRGMTWNTFLSLILVFSKNCETDSLLEAMNIYTEDLNEFILQRG